jgi:hypothetical protein
VTDGTRNTRRCPRIEFVRCIERCLPSAMLDRASPRARQLRERGRRAAKAPHRTEILSCSGAPEEFYAFNLRHRLKAFPSDCSTRNMASLAMPRIDRFDRFDRVCSPPRGIEFCDKVNAPMTDVRPEKFIAFCD